MTCEPVIFNSNPRLNHSCMLCRVWRGWSEGGRPGQHRPAGVQAGRWPSAGRAVPPEPGGQRAHPLPRQPLRQLHVPLLREPLQVGALYISSLTPLNPL